MRVLVTGAAGMIGRKLVARLMQEEAIGDRAITALDLHDVVPLEQESIASAHVAIHVGDLSEPGEAAKLMREKPDVIFHLAGVVSGRRKPISRLATAPTWTARVSSSTRYMRQGIVRGWSSRPPSLSSAARFPTSFPTISIPSRLAPTAPRR